MVLFSLINEQPRILTSGQYYCRPVDRLRGEGGGGGGGIRVCAEMRGTTYDKEGPTMHTQVVMGTINACPPDHACVRRWSTFEWDQIFHDRPDPFPPLVQ